MWPLFLTVFLYFTPFTPGLYVLQSILLSLTSSPVGIISPPKPFLKNSLAAPLEKHISILILSKLMTIYLFNA